jgi:hypothetical protein
MKVTKQQLEEISLTSEHIDEFSQVLQDALNDFSYKIDDREFIRKLIKKLFDNALSIEEKAYFYRFSVANQLAKNENELTIMDILEKVEPSILLFIRDLKIDVRKLSQFMFLPKEGTKVDVLI